MQLQLMTDRCYQIVDRMLDQLLFLRSRLSLWQCTNQCILWFIGLTSCHVIIHLVYNNC